MQEHIITKEDGSRLNWSIANNNKSFCLLYKDNNQKYKFTPTENLNCELFMIGGGGAGGYFFGGGGGAGAAYINNNYTFKKNKTYTFEVGSGGMCDIEDINKLFKSGMAILKQIPVDILILLSILKYQQLFGLTNIFLIMQIL
jgi:hypothetical protein